jgi:hypothetical protein
VVEEKGYQSDSNLPGWGTLTQDAAETNPLLQWPLSLEVYDKMRREDTQVQSVLRAVMLPILRNTFQIDPAGASDEVTKFVAENLGLAIKGEDPEPVIRTRDRFSWTEHVRLALLCLVFGHSVFEQVYRVEADAFGRMRAHLRKLAWRPPRTISEFEVARDGGLIAIKQHARDGSRDIRLKIDRLVVYVNDREGGNWVGQSLLLSCYKNWILKDRELRAQAITIERNGLGVPVYTAAPFPEGLTDPAEVEKWREAERDSGLKFATEFRSGETAGGSITNGAKFELVGVTGRLPDTDKPIRYHDEQIARGVLAHFLNLGTETGSWALGSTFADFFTDSLNAVSGHLVDVGQQHIVEDLVDANWGPTEPAPRLICAEIGSKHPVTAEAIKILIECGLFAPDPRLEAHMRALYGLPPRDPDYVPPAPAPAPAPADPAPIEEAA